MTTKDIDPETRYRNATLVWAAILASTLLYAGVGYFVRGAGTYEVGDDKNVLLLVLAALALTAASASFVLKRALLSKAARAQRPRGAQTAYIVAFAVAEGATLLGLVALFATGSAYSYLLFALGFVAILLHKPSRDQLAASSYKNQSWG